MQKAFKVGAVTVLVDSDVDESTTPSPTHIPVILMLHGWPDTLALWEPQVAVLKSKFLCVRFTLPGFAAGDPCEAHSLHSIVDIIRQVVDAVSPGQPVILLLHDWGAMFGYQFAAAHPERVAKIIGVDVGDANSPAFLAQLTGKAKLQIAIYQLWLAAAWLVSQHLSANLANRMTRFMARALHCKSPANDIRAQMNYPYFIQWSGRHGGYGPMQTNAPVCPMLFIYGTKNPFLFHSTTWAAALAARPDSAVHALPAGHWVMRDQPQAFNALVLGWASQ